MTDGDVQREIEANERRARPESEVGIDEEVLIQQDDADDTSLLDDLLDLGDEHDRTRDEEFSDNTKAT